MLTTFYEVNLKLRAFNIFWDYSKYLSGNVKEIHRKEQQVESYVLTLFENSHGQSGHTLSMSHCLQHMFALILALATFYG